MNFIVYVLYRAYYNKNESFSSKRASKTIKAFSCIILFSCFIAALILSKVFPQIERSEFGSIILYVILTPASCVLFYILFKRKFSGDKIIALGNQYGDKVSVATARFLISFLIISLILFLVLLASA